MSEKLTRALKRLRLRVWRRPQDDRDLADEIAFHLAEEAKLRTDAGIVSERLAARFTGNPIGQLLVTSDGNAEVIGVARDNRYGNVRDMPRDVAYYPMFQSANIGNPPTFEVRYAGSAAELLTSIRDAVARIDSGLTVFQATTLEARTRDSLARERLLALLSTYVGGFALLLACIRLYGLMMYSVVQRTGTRPSHGARVTARGNSRNRPQRQLPDRDRRRCDPLAFGAAVALLFSIAAAAAAYLPAWRASRINPVTALRQQ